MLIVYLFNHFKCHNFSKCCISFAVIAECNQPDIKFVQSLMINFSKHDLNIFQLHFTISSSAEARNLTPFLNKDHSNKFAYLTSDLKKY